MEEAKKDVVLTKKDVARTRNTDELCHAFWSILDLEEEHRTMCLSVVFCILAKTLMNTYLHHTFEG